MSKRLTSPALFVNSIVFAGVVGMAVYQKWSASDLLWSLWISSLFIGYLTLLIGFFGSIMRGRLPDAMAEDQTGSSKSRHPPGAVLAVFFLVPVIGIFGLSRVTLVFVLLAAVSVAATIFKYIPRTEKSGNENRVFDLVMNLLINFPAGIFMIAFFTINFGGFHFVHSIFLNGFFPLVEEQPFGKAPSETAFMFSSFIKISFQQYWFFIVASAVTSSNNILAALKGDKGDFILEPYKNVIKMHLMIFVIAFAGAAGLHKYVLYATLFLYFLPAGEMIKGIKALMTG